MSTVACGNLFLGRRSKEVKADTVARDSSQQSALRWWTVYFAVRLRGICSGIDRLPRRLPQRIDVSSSIQGQLTDMTTAFKNRNTAPLAVKLKACSAIQDARTTDNGQAIFSVCPRNICATNALASHIVEITNWFSAALAHRGAGSQPLRIRYDPTAQDGCERDRKSC